MDLDTVSQKYQCSAVAEVVGRLAWKQEREQRGKRQVFCLHAILEQILLNSALHLQGTDMSTFSKKYISSPSGFLMLIWVKLGPRENCPTTH